MIPELVYVTHPVAAIAWVYATDWEAERNAEIIKADGAMNSLHAGFHHLRTFYRVMAASALSTVASLPLWDSDPAMALSMIALIAFFACWFIAAFNPLLNTMRGLPMDYVSQDPDADLFDRFIWWVTNRLHGGVALPGYVEKVYWKVIQICLLAGIAIYFAIMWFSFHKYIV